MLYQVHLAVSGIGNHHFDLEISDICHFWVMPLDYMQNDVFIYFLALTLDKCTWLTWNLKTTVNFKIGRMKYS
jgi:hypothetical protein